MAEGTTPWPDRRPISATRKPYAESTGKVKVQRPWSYHEQWDGERSDMYSTTSRRTYQRHRPQPPLQRPEFTVAEVSGIGTTNTERMISLEELKSRGRPYSIADGPDPDRLVTSNSLAYTKPDILRARLEPRCGEFRDEDLPMGYARTSRGLLPGKTPGARFETESTYRSDMKRHPLPQRTQQQFTLSWGNAIGSEDMSMVVPPSELMKTHFEVGREKLDYKTSTRAAHTVQKPGTGQQALKAFGEIIQEGDKGTEYHIVHGGEPFKPSRYYEPSLPMGKRNSWRPEPYAPPGRHYNTLTGELMPW